MRFLYSNNTVRKKGKKGKPWSQSLPEPGRDKKADWNPFSETEYLQTSMLKLNIQDSTGSFDLNFFITVFGNTIIPTAAYCKPSHEQPLVTG